MTSDDSVLGRGFISHSPKMSCQFATKIRMIRLTFMFTWTKNKIRFCPPLRPDFSKFSFCIFFKSHKKSHKLSTSSCNSCRKLLKLWGQTWNFNQICEHGFKLYYFNFGGKLTGNFWSIADKSTSQNQIIWGHVSDSNLTYKNVAYWITW